jgi:hypothetical protein
MSLIKCPNCSSEISYNYDICPDCGSNVYELDHRELLDESDDKYNSDYHDYVTTTKQTKWYHAAILFIALLTIVLGVLWAYKDVMATKDILSGPQESYILLFAGIGLFVFTKILIHTEKRHDTFN